MYEGLGYSEMDKIKTKLTACGTRTLFKKDLI